MNKAIAFISLTVFILVLGFLRAQDGGVAGGRESGDEFKVNTMDNSPTYVVAQSTEPKTIQSNTANGQVVLQRGPDSHFRATVTINGTPIQMLVDSGASVVALSQRDAERIGIYTNRSDFTSSAMGAVGVIPIKPVVFDRVSLEGIERSNVQGAVIMGQSDQSLLGQSFLSQLGTVTVRGDTMIIQ